MKKRKAAQAGLQKDRMLFEKKIKKKRADADSAVRTVLTKSTLSAHSFSVASLSRFGGIVVCSCSPF